MTLEVFLVTTLIQVDLSVLYSAYNCELTRGGFKYVQKTGGPQEVAKRTANSDIAHVSIQVT